MRPIDADHLLLYHKYDITNWDRPFGIYNTSVENEPTLDAVPLRHGHIVWKRRIMRGYRDANLGETPELETGHPVWTNEPYCSECGVPMDNGFMRYCPNCGAKMEGEMAYDV